MYNISLNNIQLLIENKILISNINIICQNVNCLHICGNNGIGKSSLFKSLLDFQDFTYKGELLVINKSGNKLDEFVYLPQENIDFNDINIGEYLATRHFETYNFCFLKWLKFTSFHHTDWWLHLIKTNEKYLDLLDIDFRDSMSTLNYSKKRFIELLRLPIKSNSILLLDEPFEGMDEKTLKYAISYLDEIIDDNIIFIIDHSKNYEKLTNVSIIELNLDEIKQ